MAAAARGAPAELATTPARMAVYLNLLIAVIVILAVTLHLQYRRDQAVKEVQTQASNMAHAQALLISEQIQHFEFLFGRLETRLNILRTLRGLDKGNQIANSKAAESQVQDVLRQFQDLVPSSLDLLLLSADQQVSSASELLVGHQPLKDYCAGLLKYATSDNSASVHVYSQGGMGACPPDGTLIFQYQLKPMGQRQGEALWLFVTPEILQRSLLQEVHTLAAAYRFRVLGADQQALLSQQDVKLDNNALPFPITLQNADLTSGTTNIVWSDPLTGHSHGGISVNVTGTKLKLQLVYSVQEAIDPTWRAYARMWAGATLLFLVMWWLVSYAVVRLIVRQHKTLTDSELRLSNVFDSAMDAIISMDESQRIILFNVAAEKMFGWTAFDMLGQPLDRLLPDKVREHHADHVRDFGRTASSSRNMGSLGQLTGLRSGGEVFPIEASISRARVANKLVFTVIVRDVTERQKAFASLQESEHFLREAQQAGKIGIYQTDLKTEHWKCTAVLDQLFGIDSSYEHTIEGWSRLMMPADAQRMRDYFAEVIRDKKRFDFEYEIVRPSDGVRRWMHGLGDIQYDDSHQPTHLFGTVQDITERKRVEEQLKQSHDLLNKLSDQFPGVLFQFKMTAQGHFSVPFASRGSLEMFGCVPDQVKDDADVVFAAVAPDDRRAFEQSVRISAQTLQTWIHEFRVVLPGQPPRWRQGQSRPERQANGDILWHGFVADTNELLEARVALEQLNDSLELRVAERTQELVIALESAELAKRSRGEFLAKMSHEIRTPMNTILGMTYLALRNAPPTSEKNYLGKIQRAGKHLLGIIDDILDFSKVDAGKLQLENSVFDLGQTLSRVLELSEGKAIEKGLSLELDLDSNVPQQLRGDALRLGQILINFVGNAIKFTQHGGVVLRVRQLNAAADPARPEPGLLQFEVMDTGIGLTDEQMSRLFQSFEQGDNSITRKFGGSGLGLAISRQLAHLMGGEIGVTSQPGVGSTFWLKLHLHSAQSVVNDSVPCAPVPQEMTTLSGTRILLVDDNDFNLEVAQGILEEVGIQVTLAGDGADALELMRDTRFDAVLMDVQMPVMDGLEATRRIRASSTLASTIVIAMTANAREDDRALCLAAGMDDVVTKPILPEVLFATLRAWLGKLDQQADLPQVIDASPIDPAGEFKGAQNISAGAETDLAQHVVWDASALQRAVGNEPAIQRRLLDKFQLGARRDVAALTRAVDAGECIQMADLAHKLKSSAKAVGAFRLAGYCAEIERLGRLDDRTACRTLAAGLAQSFADADSDISQWGRHP